MDALVLSAILLAASRTEWMRCNALSASEPSDGGNSLNTLTHPMGEGGAIDILGAGDEEDRRLVQWADEFDRARERDLSRRREIMEASQVGVVINDEWIVPPMETGRFPPPLPGQVQPPPYSPHP